MRKLRLAGMLAVGAITLWAQDDPPSRVARLSFLEGSVSLQTAANDDWTAATPNYPLTIGDHLWADERSRAEVHIGSTAIRMDAHTALAFLNLDDRMTQVRLSDGTLNITILRMEDDEAYEIDTPNGAVTLLRAGEYRIDADPDRQVTSVTVRRGDAEVMAGGAAFQVHPGQSAFVTGEDQPRTEVSDAGAPDDFDRWSQQRDQSVSRRPPPRYVSPAMAGAEDLDEYGTWREEPGYGPVWRPRTVVADWAPYRYGRWVWVDPWGWTWVDDAPWGFAPFHYGRWALIGGGWGWVPGEYVARPVYAPALVAWVGGSSWGVSLAFGAGGGVGWFPLGPHEAYIPGYRVSNTYINRVNVTQVTNVNITNVTNVRYVNQNAPNAVTAVSRNDFVGSRSVGRSAVMVPAGAVASATVTTREVPVARAQAILARPMATNTPVARPPQAIVRTPVVTRTAPPAATAAMTRPVAVAPSRQQPAIQPAQGSQPVQSAPGNRAPVAQAPPVYRPEAAQPVPANRPATADRPQPGYRPQTQIQTAPPQATQPQAAQPQQTYRPPPQQQQQQQRQPQRQEQQAPAYRPPAQSQPINRAPVAQPQAPQAQGHSHGPDRPPDAQRRSAPAENRAAPDRGKDSRQK